MPTFPEVRQYLEDLQVEVYPYASYSRAVTERVQSGQRDFWPILGAFRIGFPLMGLHVEAIPKMRCGWTPSDLRLQHVNVCQNPADVELLRLQLFAVLGKWTGRTCSSLAQLSGNPPSLGIFRLQTEPVIQVTRRSPVAEIQARRLA